ncbi:putative inorganic phosphate cotransporter isoform X1 [Bradysia coprophila]|uniref:putative inorganic phosphate cotransporter isoform X1 n=1 Tax=Bradysia coprophila TaxID=38358 RepID=UPI00187D91F6|nr:putative inorganic phosphate cotransporter isoform X1 [Bradysia coprophila]
MEQTEPNKKCGWKRHIIVVMILFGIINSSQMRSLLPVAITQMVEPIPTVVTKKLDVSICPSPEHNVTKISPVNISTVNSKIQQNMTRFKWSQEMQGVILSAIFYGYTAGHIPAGLMVQKIGAKMVFLASILCSSVLTLITPIGVELGGVWTMIFLRVLMGLFQGGIFPSAITLISSWIPISERGLASATAFSGTSAGIILGTYFSGLLLHHFDGWSSVFYVFGAIGLISSGIFAFLCYDSPEQHPFIDRDEQEYLRMELRQISGRKPSIPWKVLLTSPPVLALICTQACHDFSFYIILSDLPKYMNDVLHVSIKDNGLYSSIPHMFRILSTFIFGYINDWITSTACLSMTNTRKLFVVIASIIPAIFTMMASYVGCNEILAVTAFAISVASLGPKLVASNINPMDLSPNFASIIAALSVGTGSVCGIVAPTAVGLMTPNSLLSEWRLVFWITAGLHVFKAIVFSVWGTADRQPWDTPKVSISESPNSEETEKLADNVEMK